MAIGMLRIIIQRVPQLRISLMATPLVQSVNSRWPFPVRLSADLSPKQVAPRKFGPVSNGFGAAQPSRPTNTLQNHKNQNRPHGKRMLRSKRILAGTFTPLLLAVSICCLNCNLSERRESQRRKEISHE